MTRSRADILLRIGKWIWRAILAAIAAVCGLVLYAASIPPEDITSNLSHWADWLGFHDVASRISDKSIDAWGIALSSVVLVIVVSLIVIPYLRHLWPFSQTPSEASQSPLPGAIPRYHSVKVTQTSIAAYVRGSPRVKRIDDIIAADARLPIDCSESGSLHREEKARVAGITDIATLDRLLEENEDLVIRMSHHVRPQGGSLPCGFGIDRLFDVIMAQAGLEPFKKFMQSLKWSTGGAGWAEEITAAYAEITSSSPGMMSLWDAAQKLYSETVGGAAGEIARSLKTKGGPLGYYCHFIKDSVSVFGNRPPSTHREKIDFTGLDIVVESRHVIAIERYGNARWENLVITEGDFQRIREELLKINTAGRFRSGH